jgi:hypothetical protein
MRLRGQQAIYGFAHNQLAIAVSGLLLRSDALDRVPVTALVRVDKMNDPERQSGADSKP